MMKRFVRLFSGGPPPSGVAREVADSGLFDARFYAKLYPDTKTTERNALTHFVRFGLAEGRRPSARFDPDLYAARYPDAATGSDPALLHYIRYGRAENRQAFDCDDGLGREIEASGLFDPDFYVSNHPEAATYRTPLDHFIAEGLEKGASPSADFDPDLYLEMNPDVAEAGEVPLLHYIRHGRAEKRPLPNQRTILAMRIEAAGLFDPDFYVSNHPEAATYRTPLEHFLAEGLEQGASPSADFDPDLYLEMNPDVAEAGEVPFLHYIRDGREEGRPFPNHRSILATRVLASGLFDPVFYADFYPDVARSDVDPLSHYLDVGAREVRRPSIRFDARAYFADHPNVAAADMHAMAHHGPFGRALGRAIPAPSFTREELAEARDLVAESGLFDPDFYLDRNPSARDRGVDPLLHYLVEGTTEALDPSREFSTLAYAAQYPSAAARGENLLLHYLRGGLSDGVPPPQRRDLRKDAGTLSHAEAILLARMAASAYFARFGFTFDPSGPTTYVAEAVAELAAGRPLDLTISDTPDVSIVIPIYGQMPFAASCLDALLHHRTRYSVEIILADDASPDEYRTRLLEGVPWIRYRRNPKNKGFLDNCNDAVQAARGRFVVLLNSDTRVLDGWLDELIGSFDLFPRAGYVGSKLLNGDGTLQEAGGLYWSDGLAWNYGRGGDPSDPRYCFARQVDWVSGASIAVPKALWDEVGGFDPFFRPAYCEDVDLAFRIRDLGHEVWYQPLSCALHFEGMTHGRDEAKGIKAHQVTNLRKLQQRWKGKLPGWRPGGFEPDMEACRSRNATMLVLDATMHRPDQDAGSVIAAQILRAYRDLGFDQTFAPVDGFGADPRYAADLQRVGVEVLHAPFHTSITDVLRYHRLHFDYVLVFRYAVAHRSIDLIRSTLPDARILFSNVDLHFLRMERESVLKDERWLRVAAARAQTEELSAFAQVDSSIVHTPVEREEVLARMPRPLDNILVLRWVSDVVSTDADLAKRQDVMFLGGFPHTPNVDSVVFFVNDVWPSLRDRLPAASRFLAVGNAPPAQVRDLACDRVIVTGRVPTVEPYFAKARVFVAPLRFGAGIKGKVIQSLANGVPVVASTIAVEGIGLRDGEHCLVADTPEAIAEAVLRLYAEPETWSRLREAGHRFVEDNFSWATAVSICKRSLDVADATWIEREAKRRGRLLKGLMSEKPTDLATRS